MLYRKILALVCACVLLAPASAALPQATAGAITGTVTDPKGAVVVGAIVTASDPATNRTLTASTDAVGRYKIENVPAGTYVVTINASGFAEARRENLTIAAGATATFDARLALASVEAGRVEVSASGLRANADPVYQQLRRQAATSADFAGNVAAVTNLMLKRDAGEFMLRSGEIYFLPPIEGRTTGAVFVGDGEFRMTPPVEAERRHLAIFTESESIAEPFTQLVMRFTDQTFDEVKASPNVRMSTAGAQTERARDVFRSIQTLLREQLRTNVELRVLVDLLSDPASSRPGFFTAFIKGKRFDKLAYVLDPLGNGVLAPEQVMLLSYGEADFGQWSSFHLADEYSKGTANADADRRLYDITHHEIEGNIRGTQLTASDRITLRPLVAGVRVLPFDLFSSLRVSRVQDEQGRDLNFIQENKDRDADFAVILPNAPEPKREMKLVIQYAGGDALKDSGGGNFFLLPRSTWYPNNPGSQFGDRAIFDMTFSYPKGSVFIGTGAPIGEETRDGDTATAKWSSGTTELAVSGFNYGRFVKKDLVDQETGYGVEFYANKEVPDEIKRMQLDIERAEAAGNDTMTTLGSISTSKMAGTALADTQNAMRVYNAYFGKLPYTRIAMSQQPAGNFGQAWPTLVFMPFTAYIGNTQRRQMSIGDNVTTFFQYVGPHEVAHQWWGHIVGWKSYRDQWMSEGFAELSTSLYVQFVRRDTSKFIDFWEEQRRQIITATPFTKGKRPYTVGPMTQGFRLNSAKTGSTYQNLVYPKGAYVLHMIRMMMYDQSQGGDKRFQTMMKDFVQTHYNKDVSTEDFKRAVEKHITPQMNIQGNGRMDWFFDTWVYGTEMPSYALEYGINGTTITGKITQSGVSDKFRMLVPIYADFGKGWIKLGSATVTGNNTLDLGQINLPQAPKRVAIAALNDVLALEIKNTKK